MREKLRFEFYSYSWIWWQWVQWSRSFRFKMRMTVLNINQCWGLRWYQRHQQQSKWVCTVPQQVVQDICWQRPIIHNAHPCMHASPIVSISKTARKISLSHFYFIFALQYWTHHLFLLSYYVPLYEILSLYRTLVSILVATVGCKSIKKRWGTVHRFSNWLGSELRTGSQL